MLPAAVEQTHVISACGCGLVMSLRLSWRRTGREECTRG